MKRNSKQFFAGVVAIIMALIAVAYVCMAATKDQWNPVKWFNKEETKTEQPDDGGATIIEGDSKNMSLMSTLIPIAQFDEYGIAPAAETAYEVTATIEPANAADTKVDFTVAFNNPESEWATGKTVTDYVTVQQQEDGALTATVTCLQAFGEQITLTCTARTNTEAKATAAVHYKQRVEGYRIDVYYGEENLGFLSSVPSENKGHGELVFKADFQSEKKTKFEYSIAKSTVYTLENNTEITQIIVCPMSPIKLALNTANEGRVGLDDIYIKNKDQQVDFLNKSFIDSFNFNETKYNAAIEQIIEKCKNNPGPSNKESYKIYVTTSDDTKMKQSFPVYIDTSIIETQKKITNLQLDKSEIEF